MSDIEIHINEFDMRNIGDSKTIAFIGDEEHIVHAVKDFLYYSSNIPVAVVISSSKVCKNMFKDHIPTILIYDEYTPDAITSFVQRQKYICNKTHYDPSYKDINPRSLLILDVGEAWINDENVKWLLDNYRLYYTTILLIMSPDENLSPYLSSNIIDYIFIGNAPESVRVELYNRYDGIFPNYGMFEFVLTFCIGNTSGTDSTDADGCLVISNISKSTELVDRVLWYKPKIRIAKFKICHDSIWEMNNEAIREMNNQVINI